MSIKQKLLKNTRRNNVGKKISQNSQSSKLNIKF